MDEIVVVNNNRRVTIAPVSENAHADVYNDRDSRDSKASMYKIPDSIQVK